MSKSGRAAYDAQQQDRGVDNYLADEAMRHHDIERRITALEEANAEPFFRDTYAVNVLRLARLRRDAVALTDYLRRNGYPKQPEPTQSDDIPF